MFKEPEKETFSEREERIQKCWEEEKTFEKSVENRKSAPHYTQYDGPPFATGLPHYGHLLAGTIKDVVLRYQTMRGNYVPRRFGWDCHGLPIESEIEKMHNLSGAKEIEAFGIDKFNEACRSIVLRYTKEWQSTVKRMGRWVDFNHTYHTMDLTFMESVWWVFKQLYDKGLIYQGVKVMPYSAKLGTPLSNFEAGENYREVDDPSVTLKMPLVDTPDTSLLVWTTTPWTLISNLAIMVGPEVTYLKIKDRADGNYYIVAKSRLKEYYSDPDEYEIDSELKGTDLEGLEYEPLFDYFADRREQNAFRVILEPTVSTEEGTGLVHSAPAFGEVDFYACEAVGIEYVCPVDDNGKFTEEIPEYQGMFVKDADSQIIRRLKEASKVVHHGTCHHRYPFCPRSDTPLIYKAVSTWFVAVEKIKDKMVACNQRIHWTPGHLKEGRFGKWLEGARDWAISRNRYWGTPIPLWKSQDGEILAIGSIEELEKYTGAEITDLHRHHIDDLKFVKDGKEYSRIKEVFDCWFESGSMPYAQNHYPFENQEMFDKNFPADFIAEGLDQTRGWFYTLTVLAAALFDRPAFKNVIVNGILLAEDGAKMSKRLRNYPDPKKVIDAYGADAIRLYLLHSPAVRADDLCFSEKGVELVLRQILIPFWNSYSFFLTYARIYNWQPTEEVVKPQAEIDRWILSRLNHLVLDVEKGMDDYNLNRAVEPFVGFIDQLTNWYIRRSRRRFWGEEATQDRHEAFSTLYQVLLTLSKVAAPFIPFLSDAIYRNLKGDAMPDSCHLSDFPAYDESQRDEDLEKATEAVQTAVSLGHSLRKEHKLKVRQPLPMAHVICRDKHLLMLLKQHSHLIADELNVKTVEFSDNEEDFVSLKAKPNFRELGKKLGKKMKQAQGEIQKLSQENLAQLMAGGSVEIQLEGEVYTLLPEEIEVIRETREGMVAANSGAVTVALELSLTEELLLEGLAREIVNKVNTMRRDADLQVTDRIHVRIESTERVEKSYQEHQSYIDKEILSLETTFGECKEGSRWDLNGEAATIAIELAHRKVDA